MALTAPVRGSLKSACWYLRCSISFFSLLACIMIQGPRTSAPYLSIQRLGIWVWIKWWLCWHHGQQCQLCVWNINLQVLAKNMCWLSFRCRCGRYLCLFNTSHRETWNKTWLLKRRLRVGWCHTISFNHILMHGPVNACIWKLVDCVSKKGTHTVFNAATSEKQIKLSKSPLSQGLICTIIFIYSWEMMGFCSSGCIQALESIAFCSRAEKFVNGWKNEKERKH